jgi:hypothetical protein
LSILGHARREIAYKLKRTPYGPAGIELMPKGLRKMIDAIHSIVETIDETSMEDFH